MATRNPLPTSKADFAQALRDLSETREQQTATLEILARHLKLARRAALRIPADARKCNKALRG
jgi:hypothetical protein